MRRRTVGPPDKVIGGLDDPYLLRWYVTPRNRLLNVYAHLFLRSDDERALHDHPWASCSILLDAAYIEHLPGGRRSWRYPGDVVVRRARAAHRIQLLPGWHPGTEAPCRTLFITGPIVRQWGFLCPQGWRHWKDFTAPWDSGQVGPGCD